MLKAKLVIVGGDAKAGEVSLELPTTLGRGKEADLTIPHALVSRSHSKLFERDGQLWVEDLGSLNGTFVDNTRIESEQLIEPNQLLTLGNITFRAVYQINASSRKTLPSTSQPNSMQTISIDPIRADSNPTLPVKVTAAGTNFSEADTDPAPVFEETVPHRSAISEIDSFDPDEIGSLDSMLEKNKPEEIASPQEPAPPASKPITPIAAQPALRASSTPKKSPEPQQPPSKEAAIDLGITGDAPLAPISSVDINLDLPDNAQTAPVSFLGKIQTGDTDSPAEVEDFQIDLGLDDKPETEVDSVRFDSFLKKLPK